MTNWALAGGGGFQNALATGLQLGNQVRQNRERNALLEQRQQQIDLQRQQQQAQAQRQAQEDRRADLPMAVKLLESAVDEPTYQRNMQIAQSYGIDTSTFPPNFDPQWRESNLSTMKMLMEPGGQEALSTIGKEVADMGYQPGTPEFSAEVQKRWEQKQSQVVSWQAGGNAASYNPATGESQMIVQGTSVSQPTPFNPNEWEIVEGGPAGNSGGGF
jgi:hypothetical protein